MGYQADSVSTYEAQMAHSALRWFMIALEQFKKCQCFFILHLTAVCLLDIDSSNIGLDSHFPSVSISKYCSSGRFSLFVIWMAFCTQLKSNCVVVHQLADKIKQTDSDVSCALSSFCRVCFRESSLVSLRGQHSYKLCWFLLHIFGASFLSASESVDLQHLNIYIFSLLLFDSVLHKSSERLHTVLKISKLCGREWQRCFKSFFKFMQSIS